MNLSINFELLCCVCMSCLVRSSVCLNILTELLFFITRLESWIFNLHTALHYVYLDTKMEVLNINFVWRFHRVYIDSWFWQPWLRNEKILGGAGTLERKWWSSPLLSHFKRRNDPHWRKIGEMCGFFCWSLQPSKIMELISSHLLISHSFHSIMSWFFLVRDLMHDLDCCRDFIV